MKRLFTITRIFPKFNWIIVIFGKEFSELSWNCCYMYLKQIWQRIKNSSYSVNRVHNDDNFWNTKYSSGMVDIISNSE